MDSVKVVVEIVGFVCLIAAAAIVHVAFGLAVAGLGLVAWANIPERD